MGNDRMMHGFQANKVRRFISRFGEKFVFNRPKLNSYNEPDGSGFDEVEVFGVYHEVNSYVTQTGADSSTTKSKPQPMVLCEKDKCSVKNGDTLKYKGTQYKVVDVHNASKIDVCVEISMEVVQVGE